jgi:hypothetical protein
LLLKYDEEVISVAEYKCVYASTDQFPVTSHTTQLTFSPYYGTNPPVDTLLVTKLGAKEKWRNLSPATINKAT